MKKPLITDIAEVNVGSGAAQILTSAGGEKVAEAKKGATVDVIQKDCGNGYSKIWFNTKECYINYATEKAFKAANFPMMDFNEYTTAMHDSLKQLEEQILNSTMVMPQTFTLSRKSNVNMSEWTQSDVNSALNDNLIDDNVLGWYQVAPHKFVYNMEKDTWGGYDNTYISKSCKFLDGKYIWVTGRRYNLQYTFDLAGKSVEEGPLPFFNTYMGQIMAINYQDVSPVRD